MKCPRCHEDRLPDDPKERQGVSVSRRDNKTLICAQCGTEESFVDAGFRQSHEATVREAEFRGKYGR